MCKKRSSSGVGLNDRIRHSRTQGLTEEATDGQTAAGGRLVTPPCSRPFLIGHSMVDIPFDSRIYNTRSGRQFGYPSASTRTRET